MVSGIGSAMSVQSLLSSELMNMGSSVQGSSQASDSATYSAISDSLQSTDEAQTASASSSGSSESSSSSEMDLNGDGKVTFDEIIQYMQMQMLNELAEGLEEESNNMDDSQKSNDAFETIKSKEGLNAYSKVGNVSGSLDLQL
ncbi:TPA: hypothetical protein IAD52_04690 [Candidatus Spyradomonas excrementavium]|nr:hypothetical protein [Candidatus Spyradomonas excrementavium]